MAVAELMRILLDRAGLGWDEAWDLTVRTLAYTNHTLLPEALEKWPVELFEALLPRQLEIIYEINRRFLDVVRADHPGDEAKVARMSLIEETPARQVRMANLAIVGTHSTNGVAAIHSELLRTRTVADFAAMFPERFSNKTNGVTPRRWLLLANPDLAGLLTEAVGDGWVTDLGKLRQIVPLADDAAFREQFLAAKRAAKVRFVDWIKAREGIALDPDSIFDTQIKRIHEYKRQLLNVLQIVVCYNRLRANPSLDVPPRTFLFAGKAAPAYRLAKLIIKLINDVGSVVNNDPDVRGKLRVEFLPNYSVTLAERLIPASDVSEQISTAGYEASGTSNMKFMMNGALTVGTRDGATIEIAEEAGEENVFLFGLTAEQVAGSRGWYDPRWHYEHEDETRQALDLIFSGHFNRGEPGLYDPIRDALLTHGDYYMHLADLASYAATQSRVSDLYADRDEWGRKADPQRRPLREVLERPDDREYAESIWGATPCPVSLAGVAMTRWTAVPIDRAVDPMSTSPDCPSSLSDGRSRACRSWSLRPSGREGQHHDRANGASRVEGGSGGSPWGWSSCSVTTPGCSPQGRGGTDAAAPGGLRRRGPPDDRPHHGRADRDDAGPPGGLHPRPGARVPQGDPFQGGRRRQGRPAPVRHRRGALQGQARRGPGEAGAGRGRPEEGAGLQGAGGRRRRSSRSTRRMLALAEVEERREQSLLQAQRRHASRTSSASRPIRKKDAAQVEADKASLEQAKADYETNILAAQADVAAAKARVPDAEIDLSYCRMSSPIDGRIGLAQVKLGNLVGPAAGGRRRRTTPSWRSSGSSTRWASTSRSPPATSTGWRG